MELSTLSALASGQFASAHEKLGRNHPTLGLKDEHLNKEFFSEVIGSEGKLLEVVPFNVSNHCLPYYFLAILCNQEDIIITPSLSAVIFVLPLIFTPTLTLYPYADRHWK